MRKTWGIVAVVMIAGAVAAAGIGWWIWPEPTFEGQTVSAWVRLSHDRSERTQIHAADALLALRPHPKAEARLREMMAELKPGDLRDALAEALGERPHRKPRDRGPDPGELPEDKPVTPAP